MATNYIAPTWRMPENGNQSKSSNYSLNFTGTQFVQFPSTNFGSGSFSISTWFYQETMANGTFQVLVAGQGYSPGNSGLSFYLYKTGSNNQILVWTNVNGSGLLLITGNANYNFNEWNHACLTREYNGSWILYLNGSPIGSSVARNTDNLQSTPSYIGKNHYGLNFRGKISTTSIFDYDLSESQVEELYGDSTSGPGDPNALPTPPITYYKLGDNANLTSGGTLPNFPNLSAGGAATYSNYSIKFATFDSFGLGNSASGIMVGKNTYSISAWFKLDVNANGAIFSNWHGGLSVNYLLRYKSTNPIGIQWYIYSGGTTSRLDTGYTPTFGAWTHVVAVKDPITNGGQSRVYINGVQAGTPLNDTTLSSLMPNINREDQIGVYNTGSDFTNGNISNVAYWTNTALTESQAEEIYNNGKTIDLNNLTFTAPTHWLPLDERSVYFNGSTLQARDIINNVDGNGINLKEENIVGDAPGSTSNGTGNNIDILDLKGDTSISSKNAYSINMADYADGITNPANSGRSTNTP
jgi:hypothetical protein